MVMLWEKAQRFKLLWTNGFALDIREKSEWVNLEKHDYPTRFKGRKGKIKEKKKKRGIVLSFYVSLVFSLTVPQVAWQRGLLHREWEERKKYLKI